MNECRQCSKLKAEVDRLKKDNAMLEEALDLRLKTIEILERHVALLSRGTNDETVAH